MPGTTRYSATFDRTYEEDDRLGPPPPANMRRSRSQSLQALSGLDGRPYTPLGPRPPSQRSSSTDSGPDHIPTRTVGNAAVKAHNNPFQFVKVGTCPLYKKAEEQLKKTKEVKKQDVFKEEEEEWQSNLDSWKSRRRKMSEDVFRRQEEIKQFELEEQNNQAAQKKIKTFSEMVESRAHRGRTLSLCLISNPLEFQDWEFENKNSQNGSCSTFTDESEENSTVNSEDEGVSLRGRPGRPAHHDNQNNHRTNGEARIEQNGSKLEAHNGDFNNVQMKPKEGSYIDSGLESISSSHRAGDTPDSCSDFSQDSNSSIDCESPRTGVNILEEFSSKSLQMSPGQELNVKLSLTDKAQEFGFQFEGGKDAGQVIITSVLKGSKAESCGVHVGDQIISIEGTDVSSKKHPEITSMVQKGKEKGEMRLLLWRHSKTTNGFSTEEKHAGGPVKPNKTDTQNAKSESQQYEKSIESENEMYVDDYEELQRQTELLTSSKKSEATCTNSQAQLNGNTSPTILSSDKDSIKSSPVPKLKEPISNGAVDKQIKNEKTDSEISTENPKKNIVKVKRVRRKGVYALDVSATPNLIPQEGIPIGCLYPLSPVSELPSPADETKSMSSTLSSCPTTPVSNSVNGMLPKVTVKETEAKLNSSTLKESNKTTASAPKSVTSKTAVPSDELKVTSSDKVESKIDSTSVQSSPTVSNISLESSVAEKSKPPSSPKKVKVKVKKANSSSEQKSSESSQVVKETPSSSVTQISDLSVKKLETECQPKKEQRTDTVSDDKLVKVNKNGSIESSQKRESCNLLSETNKIIADTKSSLKNNTSASVTSTSADKTRNLTLKTDVKNESMNLPSPSVANAKQPKTPVDEKLKPPLVPKIEKTKQMANTISSTETPVVKSNALSSSSKDKTSATKGETSSDTARDLSEKIAAPNESANLAMSPPVTNIKQPKTPVDEKSKPPFAPKKEKTKPKENNAGSAVVLPEEKSLSSKGKTTVINNDASSDKTKNLSLKIEKQTESVHLATTTPVTNNKQPQTPQEDKSKPSFAQKKEKSNSKENGTLSVETATNVKEVKSIEIKDKTPVTTDKSKNLSLNTTVQNQSLDIVSTPSVPNAKLPKTPQEEKSKPSFAQKKEKTKSKEDNGLTAENVVSVQEAKSNSLTDKTAITDRASSPNKIRNLSLNIDAQNQSVNLPTPPVSNAKLPKTPQDDKSKAPFAQKKEKTISKGKTPAPLSCDSSPVTKETFTISITCSSPTMNLAKESLPTKEQNSIPDEMTIKASNSKGKAESSETMENNILSAGTPTVLLETKSSESKEKSASSDRTRNLSLQIDAPKESVALVTTPSPEIANSKQPKTPQDEKAKPRLVRRKSKPKVKATENTSPGPSLDDKESSKNSLLHTSAAETLASESKPHKEQNSVSVMNNVTSNVLKGRTESSEIRENNILSPGTSTALSETKSKSKEKSASDKTRNLSLQIDAPKESVALVTTPSPEVANSKPPKTPQDEKAKPRLVRKRSKSKSKAAEPGPSLEDKESSSSVSHTSSVEILASENKPNKEQNSGSVANDVTANMLKGSTESSEIRENNILSLGTPTVLPETKSFESKKRSSDKTRNLSLQIEAPKESVALVTTPSPEVANSKPPKTPQDEKAKPRLVRKRSKSKSKAAEPGPSLEDKESSSSVSHTSSVETLASGNKPNKEQNSGSVANDVTANMLKGSTESSEIRENNILSPGTPTVLPETKSFESKEKSSDKTRNLSLQIEAPKESVVLVTTPSPEIANSKPPKTPQDEKAKPRLVRKRSKGKAAEHSSPGPSLEDKESDSSKNSLSHTSAAETLASESKPLKEGSSGSVVNNVTVNVLKGSTESSKIRENNILSPGTPTLLPETKSSESKEKSASDKTRKLSLQIDTVTASVALVTTPSPEIANSKPPKTPQEERTKPRLVRKRSKSKVKATENTSGPSLEDKESSNNSLSHTSATETLASESKPHKEQNSGSVANDVTVNVLKGNNESSQIRENNILSSGTPTVLPDSKSTDSKEKFAASDKGRNMSLKIDVQKESASLDTTAQVGNNVKPKTPQGEIAKPRLARKRSKSKVKNTEQLSVGPSQVDKESEHNSVSNTSTSEEKPCKEQKSGSVADDLPVKKLNGNAQLSETMEDNIRSSVAPIDLPKAKSTSLKEENMVSFITSSDKTGNLSLIVDTQKESVTSTMTSAMVNNKQPKTPQDEKAKPRFSRKKERSKSKDKTTEKMPSNSTEVAKDASNSSASIICSAENLANEVQPKKKQNQVSDGMPENALNKNKNSESSQIMEKSILSTETVTNTQSTKPTASKNRNISLKIDSSNELGNTSAIFPTAEVKQPKTPQDEKSKSFAQKTRKTKAKDNSSSSAGTAAVLPDTKSAASKDKISVANIATDSDKTRNQTLKTDAQIQSVSTTVIPPVVNAKLPKTPADEKSKPFAQKKENTIPKEKANLSLATSAVCANIEKIESQKSPSATVSSCNVVHAISSQSSVKKNECLNPTEAVSAKSDKKQSSLNPQDDKSEPLTLKKTKGRTMKKNTNSQKVNSTAKQDEELMNLKIDSLNVIFQSEPKNTLSENQSVNIKNSENNSNKKAATDLVPDIPPVEKVAEEMEKLILEQLEEEERAKELASQTKNTVGSPEHLLIAPPRLVDPPKEKPPPPPSTSEGSQKDSSLKRVNSTKRIKKEIHKRRSNFLGIDNVDESIACNEPSIPPPPALEEILKAEMELDRQSRLKIESAATERLTMEENEIMQKEREIIESLECEERQKQLLNGTEDFKNVIPTNPSDVVYEDNRILSLKNERKRIETERFMTEEQQQLHLLEEKQFREREEFIRKQEAGKSAGPHSDPSLSVAAIAPNNSKPAISSLTEAKSKASISDTNGDGENVTSNSSAGVSENKSSDGKDKALEKPAVPPKPLKKKEAIRKERERLRQEQEALQREREEHRRKLMLEQEELLKHQKSHAPDAPVTQLGPLPPLVQPNFPSQLTTTMNATPNARESASFPSRSHHGAPNGAAGSINAVELMGPPVVRQNRMPASRKAVQNEAWGQQKMPSVRKQNHDSLTESRYNQNHWLIQEAEMRRITELKERQQRATQLPCSQTHLEEDDVCSNPPRVPVISPTHNPHLNYAVQDKMWNYGQSSMPPKKYPPPVVKDPLHTVYPREAVSQQPPTKPSRVVPMERQEQMLSVSGRKRCSHCNEELGRGAAMIIESLQLYYHIHCFQCCVCQAQLGNGSCGTDVRVRNNKLHCHNCYSNDEAGLKFSQV